MCHEMASAQLLGTTLQTRPARLFQVAHEAQENQKVLLVDVSMCS